MLVQVTIPEWLKLPVPVRQRLVQIFEINRSQGTSVEGNVVISDGYTHKDLEAITLEKMQIFLDSQEPDFIKLFDAVVKKIEDEKPVEIKPEDRTRKDLLMEEWSMALGKFKSQAVFFKFEDEFNELVSKITGVTAEKVQSHAKEQTPKSTQGIPAKRRGRPAANKGTNSGDKPATEIGQGSDTPNPA